MMKKVGLFYPPDTCASRRDFLRAARSFRSEAPSTERVPIASSLAAALRDGLFEHHALDYYITMLESRRTASAVEDAPGANSHQTLTEQCHLRIS